MNLANAKVLLTIKLEGAYKPWFVNTEDREGNFKLRRVFNPELNPGSECHQVMTLSEEFVNHAISFAGRVSARMTFAYNNWKKLSQKDRLECNLGELVVSLGGSTFTYKVIPDES